MDKRGMLHSGEPGMSLRDWFAMKADLSGYKFETMHDAAQYLKEVYPASPTAEFLFGMSFRLNAKLRYQIADAMIAERNK